ncbi:MAG: GntR family transcriptional regulator [Pirellulales bacterium]|nr:GntR family transcriptional regulator [Pirellulales bacterium]
MANEGSYKNDLPPTTVESIAERLEQDIHHRGLRPGDRYLTATEAAKMFSVSAVTVNRAMQLLAKQDYLIRQRSRGTFVGPKFQSDFPAKPALDVVHVMMAMDYHQTQTVSMDSLADCLMHCLPRAVIDVQFLPESSALGYMERVLHRVDHADSIEGIVLIRCSRPVQQYVANSGAPAVIYGQAYPGVQLSSVNHDQTAVGRLMAEYAIRGGFRRCVLLTRNEWRYGDNKMLDAITQTLALANFPLDGLTIRSVPPEHALIAEMASTELSENSAPVIFLCRNEFFAEAAIQVAEKAGRRLGVDFDVVSGGHKPPDSSSRYPCVRSVLSLPEQVERLTELLCEAAETPKAPPRTITAPVMFQEPDRMIGNTRGE